MEARKFLIFAFAVILLNITSATILEELEEFGVEAPGLQCVMNKTLSNKFEKEPNYDQLMDIFLRMLKEATKVDVKMILIQLQKTLEGSLDAVQSAINRVHDLVIDEGLMELISSQLTSVMAVAAEQTEEDIVRMLALLIRILPTSDVFSDSLQAVIVVISTVATAIPGFIQSSCAAIIILVSHERPSFIKQVAGIVSGLLVELHDEVEPLLQLLRPLIPGLPDNPESMIGLTQQ